MEPVTRPDLLEAPDVADVLGVTIRDVYRLIETGRLEAGAVEVEGRTGRWIHVPRAQVDRFLTSS